MVCIETETDTPVSLSQSDAIGPFTSLSDSTRRKPRLFVVGSSGHARVVLDAIEREEKYRVVGILDSFKSLGGEVLGYKMLGREEDLPALLAAGVCDYVLVAIGDNWTRGQVVARIRNLAPALPFATVRHPSATIANGVAIGAGSVVLAGAIVNTCSRIGSFCILNTACSLDHDCVMHDFSSLAPRAVTGGAVEIGAYSAISIGATIAHEVHIGHETVIGAGSTVLTDIPARVVAYGSPAKVIRTRDADTPYLTRSPGGTQTSRSTPLRATSSARSLAIIPSESKMWKECLVRAEHDFFHTAEYHRVQEDDAGRQACLAVYGSSDKFVAWPYLLEKIAGSDSYDVTSVYGFAGPIMHGCLEDETFLRNAGKAFVDAWSEQRVVSVFTRFHPLLRNHLFLDGTSSVDRGLRSIGDGRPVGKSIVIRLSSTQDEIWKSYKRNARQPIRQCIEAGMVAEHDVSWNHFDDFTRLYYQTMKRNNALPFYFFPAKYLRALRESGEDYIHLLSIIDAGEQIVSAGLLIEYNGVVNLHLLASDERAKPSPSKLLVHEAQKWAQERGNRIFHLGGGRGAREDDPLFRFKSLFSEDALPFHIGRWILDDAAYEMLTQERRRRSDLLTGKTLSPQYFPAYRAPLLDVSDNFSASGDSCEAAL